MCPATSRSARTDWVNALWVKEGVTLHRVGGCERFYPSLNITTFMMVMMMVCVNTCRGLGTKHPSDRPTSLNGAVPFQTGRWSPASEHFR